MVTTVEKMTFNGFQENTYVVHDGEVCVIIDPGCYERFEEIAFKEFIDSCGLKPVAILLTHAHLDHVAGVHFVAREYDLDIYLHEEDMFTLQQVPKYAHLYGFERFVTPPNPTHLMKNDDKLTFGKIEFDVKFTPGHCVGHVVFYNKQDRYVINGDVLFRGSFGRYDLPGGDLNTLKRSIKETMFTLPDDTLVYCGHGPETTIGDERFTNPILSY